MARQTIIAKMDKYHVILKGAVEGGAELTERLTVLGYGPEALQDGYTIYEDAGGARITAFVARGDQRGATATVNALRHKVDSQYSVVEQIAKTVFKDDVDALTTLGLSQPAPRSTTPPASPDSEPHSTASPRPSRAQAAVFDRTRIFYRNALSQPELLSAMTSVGYPQTRLEAELADLTALEAADVQQESEKGDAKGGTATQKAALARLDAWISRFSGIVVPALSDRPDLLTKMGLKPKGGKR